MKLEYAIEKLKKLSGVDDISKYTCDIEKLVEAHNNKLLGLHARMNTLAEQIQLGLPDLYDRTVELQKFKKDSSSKDALILRFGEAEGIKRYNEKCKLSSHTKESYIQKYGEIDGKILFEEYCKTKSMSLEMCIKRHGEEEGRKIFREFWDNTGFGTSKRAFQKRHGEEWEKYYLDYCEKQGYNNTLIGKQMRHGEEEGRKIFRESNERKSRSQSKESYIQKLLGAGVSFNDIQLKIKERWDNTSLEAFCSRYGKEEGISKYNEYCCRLRENNPVCIEYYRKKNISDEQAFEIISNIQWERNKNVNRISKESLKYFNIINSILSNRGMECQYGKNEIVLRLTFEEYMLYMKNQMFFYDFFVPQLNLIIEYHGKFFHDDIDYNSTLLVTKDDIATIEYNKDFYKKWFAEQRGYTVIILRSWQIKEDLTILCNYLSFTEAEKCKFL